MVFKNKYGRSLKLPVGSMNVNKNTANNIEMHTDDSGEIMGHLVNRNFNEDAIDYVKQRLIDKGIYKGKKEDLRLDTLKHFDMYASSNKLFGEKNIKSLVKKVVIASLNTGRPMISEPVPKEDGSEYDVIISNGYFRNLFVNDKSPDKKETPIFFKHFNFGSSEYYAVLIEPKTRTLVVPTIRRVADDDYKVNDSGLDDIVTIPEEMFSSEKIRKLIELQKTEQYKDSKKK